MVGDVEDAVGIFALLVDVEHGVLWVRQPVPMFGIVPFTKR